MSLLNSIASKLKSGSLVYINQKKIKNKKAMFISIELIVVLIVVAALVIFVALMATQLKLTWNSSSVIREIKSISEGVTKFKLLYGYYPGDIPSNLISGSELDVGLIQSNIEYYETGLGSISASDPTVLKTSDFNLYTKSGTGVVGGIKSFLAHQQLTASGLYVTKKTHSRLSSSYDFTNLTSLYITNQALMSDVLNISYIFYLDSCGSGLNMCDIGTFYPLYSGNLGIYPNTLDGVPRIAIASTMYWFKTNTSGNQMYSSVGRYYTSGYVTSELASAIDNKIDDGMPFGINGKVFATDVMQISFNSVVGPSNNVYPISNITPDLLILKQQGYYGCTNLISPDAGVTATDGIVFNTTSLKDITLAQFQASDYSKISGAKNGIESTINCNMLFAISEG